MSEQKNTKGMTIEEGRAALKRAADRPVELPSPEVLFPDRVQKPSKKDQPEG